jgi:hypothetical protein
MDRRCGLGIGRDLQTDGAAKRAFQFVVQIIASHFAEHRAIGTSSQARDSDEFASAGSICETASRQMPSPPRSPAEHPPHSAGHARPEADV